MLKIFNDGPINKIDHFVFHHKLKSIAMTFFIIAVIFLAFFVFKPENAEERRSSIEYLIGVFTQGLLNWPDKEGEYDTYLLLLSISGTFLLSGFLYAMITNALIGRSDVYKEGKLRYKMAGHTVIFGANSLLEATLDKLNKAEKNKKKQEWIPAVWEDNKILHFCKIVRKKLFCNYIVIVSTHKPHTIRNRANRYNFISDHVVVYNDELDDDKVFTKLCLNNAREVFVIGDEEPKITDALNVGLVCKIVKSVHDRCKRRGRLLCNVSYFNSELLMAALSDTNKELEKPEKRDYIEIRPYNYLEGCLSFYWGNKCVERLFSKGGDDDNMFSLMTNNGKGYHFVIIGFNDIACYCVRMICSLAHFGKNSATYITMITNASQQFEYFKEELGVEQMTDITLECKASLDDLKKETGGVLIYYVVATADATMDNMFINYLSKKEHACVLGYAEDYEDKINWGIKYFAAQGQNIGYWGFKKPRTHVLAGENVYNHARLLFDAYKSIETDSRDFWQLNPMEQRAWMDFYSYLYYLIKLSGCKLQRRPETNTQTTSGSVLNTEQEIAEKNTIYSLTRVESEIDTAMEKYKKAQNVLHRVDSIAAYDYLGQLKIIDVNYRKIVARYLAKANKTGLELVV